MSRQEITLSERGRRNLRNILVADGMTGCIESVSDDGTKIVLDTAVPGGTALLRTITEAGSVAMAQPVVEDVHKLKKGDGTEVAVDIDDAELEEFKNSDNKDWMIDEFVRSGKTAKDEPTEPSTEEHTGPSTEEHTEPKHDGNPDTLRKIAEGLGVDADLVTKVYSNVMSGKWTDGSDPTPEQAKNIKLIQDALAGGSTEELKKFVTSIGKSAGKLSAVLDKDGKDTGLVKSKSETQSVKGVVRVPEFFKVEPDDSMWNEMVITEFGIPMVNMGHPAVKKIIQSEDPKQDCKGDLKQFIKAIKGNPGLSKVFDTGVLRAIGKMGSLLTLGLAAKTMDAGKRADRIIKELKEKGGVHANRNLLAVKAEDILSVDPDNEHAVVTVVPYNRKNKAPMDPFQVPAASLNTFYSVVDPIASAKAYVELITNGINKKWDTSKPKTEGVLDEFGGDGLFEDEELFPETPLVEGTAGTAGRIAGGGGTAALLGKAGAANAIGASLGAGGLLGTGAALGAGLGAGAAIAGGAKVGKGIGRGIMNLFGKDDGGYDPSAAREDKTKADNFAEIKQQYVQQLSEQGHPDFYILKPKSENKEVDIISTAATGYTTGSGKVHMVGMKINGHEAAAFMKPSLIKKYFSWS